MLVMRVVRRWPLAMNRGMVPKWKRVAVKWSGVEVDCQRKTAVVAAMMV